MTRTTCIRVMFAAVATAAVAAAAAAPASRAATAPALGLRSPARVPSAVLTPAGARLLARASWNGGAYATAAGSVTVYVSPSYSDPDGVGRRWAAFFASLVHGSELALLRAYVAPIGEVRALCESSDVLGCYGGGRLVMPGEAADGVAAEEIGEHEYGHHVAANRVNRPWAASDWGTKRWASSVGVCARAAAGTAFPGDEGGFYPLNPGEAFAESYRVLNDLHRGAHSFDWPIVDPSFRPTSADLAALEEDVVHPWERPTTTVVRSAFRRGGPGVSTLPLTTPLDGDLTVTLRLPLGAADDVALLDAGGHAVATGLWSGSGRKTLQAKICGVRSFSVRVVRRGAAGRFTLVVTRP